LLRFARNDESRLYLFGFRPNSGELIEGFEGALERGEAVSLRLPQHDLERIKTIARPRGISYETLISAVLRQFALSETNRG
jgi:hypothetical protein